MEVKDLVKGKTYSVFDYVSFYLFGGCEDDFFVLASYLGCFGCRYMFLGVDDLFYSFSMQGVHGGYVRECD